MRRVMYITPVLPSSTNIWCSKDTSPWVSAIAQDGYSFEDVSVFSTSWLPANGSYCQNLSKLSHQWIGSELIGRKNNNLTATGLSDWTGVTTDPWFEEKPIDWLLSSPWIHNNSSSNWIIISSALSASQAKSTIEEQPTEEVADTRTNGVTSDSWFEDQPIDWLLSSPWIHNNSSSNWVIISSTLSASQTKSTSGNNSAKEEENTEYTSDLPKGRHRRDKGCTTLFGSLNRFLFQ